MSDVLAAAAGSRFEPPAAGALGGFSGPELSSGTGRAAGPGDGGGRGGDAAWAAVRAPRGGRAAGGERGDPRLSAACVPSWLRALEDGKRLLSLRPVCR